MKLVQLSAGRNSNNSMDRVALFNTSELLWRYPLGFQPSAYPYPPLEFKTHLPNSLANDPRSWSREDVVVFLRWCECEFDLPPFDMEFFQMNGKALCLLTKSDLNERSPGCGDVLHNVLHMLMRERMPSSPLTPHFPLTPSWSIEFPTSQNSVTLSPAPSVDSQGSPRQPDQPQPNPAYLSAMNYTSGQSGSSGSTPSDSDGEEPNSPTVQTTLSSPQPQSPINAKPQIFFPSDNIAEPNTNGRLLWDFLQQLLNDSLQRYTSYIAWKNRDAGVFKIVDPPGLAKLWGIQKNHLSMNYDKMSRALRYYYRVNILRKVQGERHCYQFLRNPSELKSIKNISLLRHQIGSQQPSQQPQQQQQPQATAQTQQPQQTQTQQNQTPTQQPQTAQGQQSWQQQYQQQQIWQQQQQSQSNQQHIQMKTEHSEDEPTDLSIHSHCQNMSAEVQLSLHRDEYPITAQAEDLSVSHLHTIKTETS